MNSFSLNLSRLTEITTITVSTLVFWMFSAAMHANAGSLGYQSLSAYTEWEPDCSKPDEPYFSVYDVDSFNYAVQEFNYYLSEVEAYLECMAAEAESDIEIARMAILNGYEEKRSMVIDELESAKYQLESQRYLID